METPAASHPREETPGPPAEPPHKGQNRKFEGTARATLGTDVIDQDEFAAVLEHAYKIVKRRLGIRHCGDDVLRYHCVEKTILEGQVLGVHDRKRLDVIKTQRSHALLRLAQHRLRGIIPPPPPHSWANKKKKKKQKQHAP